MAEVEIHSIANEKILDLTSSALARVLICLAESKRVGMRLSLKKTGCSGLAYVFDYVDAGSADDIALEIAANKFIFIEKKSFPYLKGLKIDYVRQGINHKFIYENPNQTGQCGCGESFSVR